MTRPTIEIVWRVLPRALETENWTVIEACRRLIVANRLGWKRFTNAADWNTVFDFDTAETPQTNDLIDCLND